jgi:hypothetical protein
VVHDDTRVSMSLSAAVCVVVDYPGADRHTFRFRLCKSDVVCSFMVPPFELLSKGTSGVSVTALGTSQKRESDIRRPGLKLLLFSFHQ